MQLFDDINSVLEKWATAKQSGWILISTTIGGLAQMEVQAISEVQLEANRRLRGSVEGPKAPPYELVPMLREFLDGPDRRVCIAVEGGALDVLVVAEGDKRPMFLMFERQQAVN